MNRLVIIIFIAFALALGMVIFGHGEDIAHLNLGKYHVESSVFVLTIIFTLLGLLLISLVKFIFLIFDLPFLVHQFWARKKLFKANESLIQAVGQNIIGNKKKSFDLVNKLKIPDGGHSQDIQTLLKGENTEDLDQKIESYNKLTNSKEYKFHAFKKLAEIYYQKKFYEQSEEYAVKAFNINSSDPEILKILIHCYAYLKQWSKFDYAVSTLQKVDPKSLKKISEEVAIDYFNAAKTMLGEGDDNTAELYTQAALELKPGYIEAIDLYVALAISNNKHSKAIEILKLSFRTAPSLELAQIYAKVSNDPPEKIFEELLTLAHDKKNSPLFLALASSMNLPKKIEAISHIIASPQQIQ